jgi:hypothetical protein
MCNGFLYRKNNDRQNKKKKVFLSMVLVFSNRKEYEFIQCKLAVGKAEYREIKILEEDFLNSKGTSFSKMKALSGLEYLPPSPPFDSLYLSVTKPESETFHMSQVSFAQLQSTQAKATPYSSPTDVFQQSYCIFDNAQILPLYLVKFYYNPEDDEREKVILFYFEYLN